MEVFISLFMKYLGYKPMEKLTLLDARTFILDKRRCGISASTCNFIFIQCSQCRKNCILWCTATRNFFMIHSIIRIFIWSCLAEDLILRICGKIKDNLEYHVKARNLQNHYEFKELLDILYNRSDSYLPCKRLQEWWKIYPTYDQGNRLSADVFDACASQRVCKDPSL